MARSIPSPTVRPFKALFIGVELTLILLTLAALADVLLGTGWGLGLSVFLLGFAASAWGLAAYHLCGGCCGWDRKGV